MEFSPNNHVVRLCIQGMDQEAAGRPADAAATFMQAWQQATNDFERFTAAWYVARHQPGATEQLHWLREALQCALNVNDISVAGAYPALYAAIARCYQDIGDTEQVQQYDQLAAAATPMDHGPFYHGTRASLSTGDLLVPGGSSNYETGLTMNHIYFTALANGAGLAAALAKGDAPERVYIVEPTGAFENDPNVTNKRFPGNPTRSYRSGQPLRIVGELREWTRQTPEQIQAWRDRLANSKGEIIN